MDALSQALPLVSPAPARASKRYLPHGPFQAALELRVEEHLRRLPHRPPALSLKTAIIFGWLLASYLYALLLAEAGWQVALAAFSIGLAMAAVGFNVQHDGGHKAYALGARTNALAAAALDLIGGSSYIWAWKHNVFHHSHPNCVGLDADIDIGPLCRLAPAQRRYPWHRFQHVYIWALYALLATKWLFDDFRDLFNGAVCGLPFPRPRGWKLAHFGAGKLFFVGWSMALPAVLHPLGHVAAAWLLASVTISLVLATVFQMAHVVERAAFLECDGSRRWAESQVASTADFAQGNRLLTWYIGGLNFQIEHHLFPGVCHLDLPALAPVVRATCEEFGVPYHAYPSAGAALASHARWLRKLGAPDALARGGDPAAQ